MSFLGTNGLGAESSMYKHASSCIIHRQGFESGRLRWSVKCSEVQTLQFALWTLWNWESLWYISFYKNLICATINFVTLSSSVFSSLFYRLSTFFSLTSLHLKLVNSCDGVKGQNSKPPFLLNPGLCGVRHHLLFSRPPLQGRGWGNWCKITCCANANQATRARRVRSESVTEREERHKYDMAVVCRGGV